MKTFRLIGTALLAVILCINLVSCSSDENNPIEDKDNATTTQKKLIELKEVDDRGYYSISKYSYGDDGRLSSATCTWNEYSTTYTINWGANVVIESFDKEATTFTLENGLIKHMSIENATFSYNSSKQIIKMQNSDIFTDVYTWEGDKFTSRTTYQIGQDEYTFEYIYSGKTCKGYLPIMIEVVENDNHPLIEAHPEMIGMRCYQLPDQVYHKKYNCEYICKYTYTFDKDGYVESCTKVETEKSLSDNTTYRNNTTLYTFIWE